MSTLTSIEWTDVSWNPVRGCSLVSAGCANCYAMKQAHRFSGAGQPYAGLTELGPHGPRWTGKIQLVEEALDAPLHWKKPRRIFVNSMSDLFHEDVPDEFIHKIFAVMALSPRHTFQVLTKRPERMLRYLRPEGRRFLVEHHAYKLSDRAPVSLASIWPLPNLWLGVSIDDQKTADERIPILLQTPAAVRWVSAEPLLGPVDLDLYLSYSGRVLSHGGIDWVVVGGESGPGARPCDVAWIRSIRDQCQAAGVPVFVKQLGSQPYVVEGSRDAQEWSSLGASAAMDDCGGIHTKDRKGNDPAEWPTDLRVREWPR